MSGRPRILEEAVVSPLGSAVILGKIEDFVDLRRMSLYPRRTCFLLLYSRLLEMRERTIDSMKRYANETGTGKTYLLILKTDDQISYVLDSHDSHVSLSDGQRPAIRNALDQDRKFSPFFPHNFDNNLIFVPPTFVVPSKCNGHSWKKRSRPSFWAALRL